MEIDDYGRVVLDPDEMIDRLLRGHDISGTYAQPCEEIENYNRLCRLNDKTEYVSGVAAPLDVTPEEFHAERQNEWFVPSSYQELDVWGILRGRCTNSDQLARLEEERLIYEERGLLPMLRLMMYLVDEFRARKIVWGVGRGSSVASFALYLIGITRIDPITYGLDIGEFLKD